MTTDANGIKSVSHKMVKVYWDVNSSTKKKAYAASTTTLKQYRQAKTWEMRDNNLHPFLKWKQKPRLFKTKQNIQLISKIIKVIIKTIKTKNY